MGIKNLRATATIFCLLWMGAGAADSPLDAVSGASGGRKMVTISKVTVTTSSAAITFSEGYRNGSLRLYYSTTAFANASDTTRSTVTKLNVSTRGSGTVNISGLKSDTKYYYRFQGYYPKGVSNYWATGSFSTEAIAGIAPASDRSRTQPVGFDAVDALGRRSPDRNVTHSAEGSDLGLRSYRR
ncbi:MAG TPA: hypothetical protein PKO15_14440 [Fibrobacteria bacterium]|nr:hypothetical protein [Fibrobacteria bacterium]HOX53554.1 hypothetical protein [Fibrobacteria bacterium]